MRFLLPIMLILIFGSTIFGQENIEGEITYITSQHIYVKFSSMKNISAGDTLYIKQGIKDIPALQIQNLSSTSCVCIPLLSKEFKVSEAVFAHLLIDKIPEPVPEEAATNLLPIADVEESDSLQQKSPDKSKLKQDIGGRISVSSYSNLSNNESAGYQKMRYNFSMNAKNLGNSKLSLESYVSFSHSNTNWEEVQENIFKGLKIYNLSAKYDFSETMHLLIGRKINPKLSSVGAIDGLQFEKKFGALSLGAFAGSRPDYLDYSINFDLLQYGIYLGHSYDNRNGNMQNTLAFIEQTNNSATDRRFGYFQHTNSLVKNLFFFASAEVDLYKKVNETAENTFDLTNTYLSLRYRIIRPLSIGLSFSSRHNLIYYETYKDFLERLLESEAMQGWRFRINYHPAKYLYLGVNAGYRFKKEDPRPTKNFHGYLTYSNIPGIGVALTASTTWIETSYLTGTVYGLGLSRDLVPGKLRLGLKYRYVDYLYINSETTLIQHVGEANISWMVYRKLSLSVNYEGTLEKEVPYNRLYINISQRF